MKYMDPIIKNRFKNKFKDIPMIVERVKIISFIFQVMEFYKKYEIRIWGRYQIIKNQY